MLAGSLNSDVILITNRRY